MLKLDPRITAQDLDENLQILVGTGELHGYDTVVRIRANFLTVEMGTRHDPTILWVPLTNLLLAINEMTKRVGN